MHARLGLLLPLCGIVFLLSLAPLPAVAGDAATDLATALATGKVQAPQEVRDALQAQGGTSRFIVRLKSPARTAAPASLEDDADKAAARDANAAILSRFFSRKKSADTGTVDRTFDYMPAFATQLAAAQLASLAQSDDVAAIEHDARRKPALRQGIPLMNAAATRTRYNGAGVAVAVCDTGVDSNNAYLGGPGFPNAIVLGGRDTALGTDDPMDANGHGTSVAGIIAGAVGDVGDYIGGVAPGAKIYALKVTDNTGTAPDSAIIAAWEWAITNQNKAPASPIRIINVSMGGGHYTAACDDTHSNYVAAAATAAKAGIAIFISSGNDGYCDGMGSPACLSGVLSVGAVYDAAFGTAGACVAAESCAPTKTAEPGCTSGYYAEDASAADKVTSYSNSASFLTMFAPADQCYTLQCAAKGATFNTAFGGTSAASPYAAGAAAALQNAAKTLRGRYLTPAELKTLLVSTGKTVTDGKVAVTKPRLNLGAAISALTGSPASTSLLLLDQK